VADKSKSLDRLCLSETLLCSAAENAPRPDVSVCVLDPCIMGLLYKESHSYHCVLHRMNSKIVRDTPSREDPL
jgi:hypothetical protein